MVTRPSHIKTRYESTELYRRKQQLEQISPDQREGLQAIYEQYPRSQYRVRVEGDKAIITPSHAPREAGREAPLKTWQYDMPEFVGSKNWKD